MHTIQNCDWRFRFQCPLAWDQLARTGDAEIRDCGVCLRPVYRCHSEGEAAQHARLGRCVAVEADLEDGDSGVILMGDLEPS